MNDKLDLILNKIDDIDSRLKKIENQSNDIHQFVPFVSWLDQQAKNLSSHLEWWFTSNMIENVKINNRIE